MKILPYRDQRHRTSGRLSNYVRIFLAKADRKNSNTNPKYLKFSQKIISIFRRFI